MSRKLILSILGLFILACGLGQARAQECAHPGLIPDAKSYNIFSPEQEMILGDLTYQRLSGERRFIKDPALLAYVNDIGNRLVSHLPPTNLKFRFFIVDLPEANAFNIPGGYVFISRKLIALTNNEAELAGVIAHELGHAVVRHAASNVSERLRKILNVTKVGDRKDIAEKYNLLIERRRTKTIVRPPDHESDQQIQADSVGLFAMVSAGYDPNAFAEFFGRLAEAKASSGNWFADIFGVPSPEQQRIRKMIKIAESIPARCRESLQANVTTPFVKWQADVVSYRETNRNVRLDGLLWKRELTSRLRSDIFHFAFSPDGEHFLAQDDFGITVIQRAPLKVVFQIPVAPLAHEASFSPDGQFIVYGTQNLRFEKWSIADRKPVAVRELVVRGGGCDYEFSPDGKYLACVHIGDKVRQTTWENKLGANIRILETETGKLAWEKKDFYWLSHFEFEEWLIEKETKDRKTKEGAFFHFEFSPDARILVVSRSTECGV